MRVFFGRAKIRGGGIWNWSLEMKENFGIRSLAVASWWMAAVISWWALDGCCYFLMASGWLLLFPDGLWMVTVRILTTHRILKIEGNIWYEVGLPNLCTSNLSLSKISPGGTFLRGQILCYRRLIG